TDLSILIHGETGTGKELVAAAVHEESKRNGGPFVVVDCASIPGSLAESLLFGHERGAFTGAMERHMGAFQDAHKGTIFLDELGDLGTWTLAQHDWPGNIRELVNVASVAASLAPGAEALASVLPLEGGGDVVIPTSPFGEAKRAAVASFEQRYFGELYRMTS